MATVKVTGMDDLDSMLTKLGNIPFDVISEALDAMSEEAAKAVKRTGNAMDVRDPESSVHILDKIRHTKPKQTEDGGVAYVTFSGTRKRGNTRTRNAEIAFINEYGKPGQPARPFIRQAAEQYADAIGKAGEDILTSWQEKTFTE